MTQQQDPKPMFDFSGAFSKAMDMLQLIVNGMKLIVSTQLQGAGRFAVYAGGGVNQQLQIDTNGVMRSIHNQSGVAANVVITDGMNSQLVGSPSAPVVIPAGGFTPGTYLPFKAGLRATVTPATAFIVIGGDVT